MIERIVENWLTKSSERSYQLPFCLLLQQEGKTVIHLTRHTAMEHGKDVIALDTEGRVHAYQLKGVTGNHFTLSDWQSIQNQIYQLVYTPVTHPSVHTQEHHISYLVINGDMNEEVQHAIYAWNQARAAMATPKFRIEVIVKGNILEMALRHKEHLIPSELVEVKNLLELYLRDGREFLDKAKFSRLLESVLNDRPPKSANESNRLVSSTALLCSLASSSYTDAQNHLAIIEAWVIYLFGVLRHCELYGRDLNQYRNETGLAQKIITGALVDLYAESKEKPELLQGNPLVDAFVLKHRKTMLLGMISFLAMMDEETPFEEFHQFISTHFNETTAWGESAVPFFLSIYFMYKSKGEMQKANAVLTKVFTDCMEGITNPDVPFHDIYESAEDCVVKIFSDSSGGERFSLRISRILEPLIALASQPDLRELLENNWAEVSHCIFTELRITHSRDFYLWRVDDAQHINKHPKLTQSWKALLDQGKIFDAGKVPAGIQAMKYYLPLFLMVYPQRLDADLLKWYSHQNI